MPQSITSLAGLDPESDGPLMVRVPPNSAANVVIWLAAEVGAPDGHSSASRLQRSRLAHLHAMLVRVTQAMRSVPSRSGNAPILHRHADTQARAHTCHTNGKPTKHEDH